MVRSALVSVFVTVIGTVLAVIVTGMMAYVLYRKDFKFRKVITYYIFFTMLFSGGMVPSYIINTQVLHLGDTLWILFLPSLCVGWNVIILRTFFTQSIPDSLVEAAHIDGAGEATTFFKIILPLAAPGLATIGLFSMIGFWNDWLTGLLYINNANLQPLQVMLEKIESNLEYLKANATLAASTEGVRQALETPSDSVRMGLAVIVMTPIIFAYPFFQRYFIQGLTIGSVKG